MKFCFVILHYNVIEETIKCVQSILELNRSNECGIVIVDNASPNGTGKELLEKYKDEKNIKVVLNESNSGFSKGNNIGYVCAKEKFNPQFIVATNNDTVFPQKDFLCRIEQVYNQVGFDVLGPDIYVPATGEHQSPIKLKMPSLEEVKAEVEEHKYLAKHMVKYEFQERCLKLRDKLYELFGKKIQKTRKIDHTKMYESALLSGACLIFSEKYLSDFELLFTPEVNFYFEESLLLWKCIKNHKKVIYYPEILVQHNHRVATKKSNKNFIQKRTFIEKNMIESGETLIKVMVEQNESKIIKN